MMHVIIQVVCTSTRPVESLRRVHGRGPGDDVQLAAPPDFFNLLASQSPGPFLKFTDFISNVHAVSDVQRGIPERGDASLRGGDRSLRGGDNLGLYDAVMGMIGHGGYSSDEGMMDY